MSKGQRMKAIREKLGLSAEVFGNKIELTRSSVSLLENEHREVTDRTIKITCSEFNINETWLRTGEGEMYKPKREYKDNLMGLIGGLTDDLVDEIGKHSEFKEWLATKVLRLPDEHLDVLKEIILGFVDDEIKDLDIKNNPPF